MVTRDRGRC